MTLTLTSATTTKTILPARYSATKLDPGSIHDPLVIQVERDIQRARYFEVPAVDVATRDRVEALRRAVDDTDSAQTALVDDIAATAVVDGMVPEDGAVRGHGVTQPQQQQQQPWVRSVEQVREPDLIVGRRSR